jgi:hypothetical protein
MSYDACFVVVSVVVAIRVNGSFNLRAVLASSVQLGRDVILERVMEAALDVIVYHLRYGLLVLLYIGESCCLLL